MPTPGAPRTTSAALSPLWTRSNNLSSTPRSRARPRNAGGRLATTRTICPLAGRVSTIARRRCSEDPWPPLVHRGSSPVRVLPVVTHLPGSAPSPLSRAVPDQEKPGPCEGRVGRRHEADREEDDSTPSGDLGDRGGLKSHGGPAPAADPAEPMTLIDELSTVPGGVCRLRPRHDPDLARRTADLKDLRRTRHLRRASGASAESLFRTSQGLEGECVMVQKINGLDRTSPTFPMDHQA